MAVNFIVRKLFHTWFLIRRPMTLGVRVIVEDDEGRILLVRHTYVPGWYLPGGGVERGQTQQEAAAKEVFEEAGIRLDSEPELIGVYWNRNASPRDHVSLFKCRDWTQEVAFTPNREIAEIGFFALDQLPKDTTKGTRRRIDEVYNNMPRSAVW